MSHGVWVQRTPRMAYNVQGYNNVPWGMDERTVSPGRWLRAYICRVLLGDKPAPALSMARTSIHPLKWSSLLRLRRPRSYSFTCPVHGGSPSGNTWNLFAHSCFTWSCLSCQVTSPPCSTMRFLAVSCGIFYFYHCLPCGRSCTMWYFHFFIIFPFVIISVFHNFLLSTGCYLAGIPSFPFRISC